jgi:hypothetical protein
MLNLSRLVMQIVADRRSAVLAVEPDHFATKQVVYPLRVVQWIQCVANGRCGIRSRKTWSAEFWFCINLRLVLLILATMINQLLQKWIRSDENTNAIRFIALEHRMSYYTSMHQLLQYLKYRDFFQYTLCLFLSYEFQNKQLFFPYRV